MSYTVTRSIVNQLEHIRYVPAHPRCRTPILLQHGMYHSAQCWGLWQELLAEWGWESHAYSLPGHGLSPVQRPIRWCTLAYYFEFLVQEIRQYPQRPVVMGHSMGGALIQWYLKYGGDDLPAAVLVGSWPAHSMVEACRRYTRQDPWGVLLNFLTLTTTPSVRNPRRVGQAFLTAGAIYTPEALYAQVGPESLLVLLQYQPPFWQPAQAPATPLLWLAGERDALITEQEARAAAQHYRAEYRVVKGAGHNLMMEKSYRETLDDIHDWLCHQKIT